MKFFSYNAPFGMPPGTVRAALVILMALAIIIPVFKFAAYHEDIPQTVVAILSMLFGGLIGIVKDYFASRADEETRVLKAEVERLTKGGPNADPPVK